MNNIDKLPFEKTLGNILDSASACREYPIFYSICIGSANHKDGCPDPSNKHELPDYINALPYKQKVLILIDPCTKIPLNEYGYALNTLEDTEFYSHYNSEILNEYKNPYLDIYVIKKPIYLESNHYNNNEYDDTAVHFFRQFLVTLVTSVTSFNPNSLVMISNFTGLNMYHLQDEMINLFDGDIQADIRDRFLVDSRYYSDLGCYYDLLNPVNQPIIKNGRFFNPGKLSPIEFNMQLIELLNMTPSSRQQQIISYLKVLFEQYVKENLNATYREYRVKYAESKDDSEKIFYLDKMLEYVILIMMNISDFININEFMQNLRKKSIYSHNNEMILAFEQISESIFNNSSHP